MANTITCHICGAQNNPVNHFCDQCGARLDSQETVARDMTMDQPVTPSQPLSCAACGAQVLPGQAFCDNCGADLRTTPPTATEGAPASPAGSPDQDATMVPPSDATMLTPPMGSSAVPPEDETILAPRNEPDFVPPPDHDQDMGMVPPEDETVVAPMEDESPDSTTVPSEDETIMAPTSPQPPELPMPESVTSPPPPEPPTPEPPMPELAGKGASSANRQQLEADIERHKATIAQLEQMLAPLPAGSAPAYLTTALEDARRALKQAEEDLAALPSGPDPNEVARLEEERSRHNATIQQMEQMLQTYPGGSAPSYLAAALEDARRALKQVEEQLATLHSSGVAPGAPTLEAPADAGGMAPSQSESAGAETIAVPPTPPPQTAPIEPAGPRLVVVDGNHEIPLPTGKSEIIIGREDPVSHIFPEVDLTPFGGESGGVSRQHARLNYKEGQWTVTDLNSTNFTHVDGKRLEPNTPTPVQDGMQIRLGRVSLTFRLQ